MFVFLAAVSVLFDETSIGLKFFFDGLGFLLNGIKTNYNKDN
ncbi:MAG: hypothetical protein QW400_03125 [Candidatus Diapherotrites archaeon]